jgi:opacity protein-like surface antigen
MPVNLKIRFYPFYIGLLLSLGIHQTYANTAAFNVFGGGSSFNLGDQEDIVFPSTSFRTDTFTINQKPIVYALGAGVTYQIVNCQSSNCGKGAAVFNSIIVGVNGYYNHNTRTGSVLEYGLTDFANSNYKTNISSARLMADAEVDFQPLKAGLTPFVEAGIGIARNVMDFKNSPVPDPDILGGYYYLDDNYLNQFAYEIGVGIKVPITQDVVISARYLYADAGNAKTRTYDPSSGVILAKSISVSVRSQSVLLGFSHQFG